MIFYYFSLSIIFFISLFVVWEDINTKKIRNHWIILGFVTGCLLFLIGYISGFVSSGYILKVIINSALSLAVGFVIWRLGFWPAGDSKLFVLFSFLLPLHYYWKTYLEYFPSFVLLVNIFALFLTFLFIKSCCVYLKKATLFLGSDNNYGKIITDFFKKTNESIKKLKDIRFLIKVFLKVTTGILIYFLLTKFYFRSSFYWKGLALSVFIFWLIRSLFKFYVKHYSRESIKISDLKPKMNLADEAILKLKKDTIFFKKLGVLRAEGLDDDQADLVREYFIRNNIREAFIYKNIPFSVWIALGTAFTVLFKGIAIFKF